MIGKPPTTLWKQEPHRPGNNRPASGERRGLSCGVIGLGEKYKVLRLARGLLLDEAYIAYLQQ